jgi:hypothetical protein
LISGLAVASGWRQGLLNKAYERRTNRCLSAYQTAWAPSCCTNQTHGTLHEKDERGAAAMSEFPFSDEDLNTINIDRYRHPHVQPNMEVLWLDLLARGSLQNAHNSQNDLLPKFCALCAYEKSSKSVVIQ